MCVAVHRPDDGVNPKQFQANPNGIVCHLGKVIDDNNNTHNPTEMSTGGVWNKRKREIVRGQHICSKMCDEVFGKSDAATKSDSIPYN
jgi:hypothetical protein